AQREGGGEDLPHLAARPLQELRRGQEAQLDERLAERDAGALPGARHLDLGPGEPSLADQDVGEAVLVGVAGGRGDLAAAEIKDARRAAAVQAEGPLEALAVQARDQARRKNAFERRGDWSVRHGGWKRPPSRDARAPRRAAS